MVVLVDQLEEPATVDGRRCHHRCSDRPVRPPSRRRAEQRPSSNT